MNVIAVNGSPRREWNSATLLKSALEGAQSVGATTQLVHLYDLDYRGCTSCFACKRKGNTCAGLCAVRDDLRSVLSTILESDVLFIGSPVYFDDVTGATRSFLERLLFANISYDAFGTSVFPGQVSCGLILTMSRSEDALRDPHYASFIRTNLNNLKILKGETEALTAHETLQFADYSAVDAAVFDAEERVRRHKEVFPVDCRKAFDMGARMARS